MPRHPAGLHHRRYALPLLAPRPRDGEHCSGEGGWGVWPMPMHPPPGGSQPRSMFSLGSCGRQWHSTDEVVLPCIPVPSLPGRLFGPTRTTEMVAASSTGKAIRLNSCSRTKLFSGPHQGNNVGMRSTKKKETAKKKLRWSRKTPKPRNPLKGWNRDNPRS